MAGYSGTPLAKKLGVKDDSVVAIVTASGVGPSPFEITATATADAGDIDVLLVFVTTERDLRAGIAEWSTHIQVNGMVWICWPKKTARKIVPSDITEDLLRDVILPLGLVDVKVCAVDDIWSGLKFMWRKELRGKILPATPSKATRA
jgi:hypothetical protein